MFQMGFTLWVQISTTNSSRTWSLTLICIAGYIFSRKGVYFLHKTLVLNRQLPLSAFCVMQSTWLYLLAISNTQQNARFFIQPVKRFKNIEKKFFPSQQLPQTFRSLFSNVSVILIHVFDVGLIFFFFTDHTKA